jgi:hypothetical protein
MSITVVNSSSGYNTAGSSLTLNVPSGTAAGNLMLAFLTYESPTATITPPSGWILFSLPGAQANPSNLNGMFTIVYYRYASGSEPSSYTWNFSQTVYPTGGIATLANTVPSSPLDTTSQNNGITSAPTADSITTTSADDLLIVFFSFTSTTFTFTPPSGFTSLWNISYVASDHFGSAVAIQSLGAAGATGNAVGSPNCSYVAWQIAILASAPPPASPATVPVMIIT